MKYGINLNFETIVQFFSKIMQLNAVIILKRIPPKNYVKK